ncbi:MAG: branched-chain amino acid ABC transporter permease, partial [Pseudomonadota bacterium]
MSAQVSKLSPRIRYSLRDPRFVVIVAGAIILLALPPLGHALGQSFLTSFVAKMMIFAIAAASLDLILGYGGMVSFGHAAYIGLGGYAVGIFSKYAVDFDIAWMQSGFIHFPMAIMGSALVALLIGAICLRTSGLYFIMITLAFTQMLYFLGISLEPFGGDDGMNLDRSEFFGVSLNDNLIAPADGDRDLMLIYYVTFLCLMASLFVLRRFVNSRFGMVVRGSYSNPVRMEAVG